MAVIKAASSHASIKGVIRYITKEEKTDQKLITGLHCSPETAAEEMTATKEFYGKCGGRTYKHFIQSFAPGENITAEKAHAIAREFAERCRLFNGYEVLLATHRDRQHIHTHFVVNSVSWESGYKFQMRPIDLQEMKDLSDSICLQHGLSITQKGHTFSGLEREETTAYSMAKYKLLEKAEHGQAKSYVQETALQVLSCCGQARSKEEFCTLMQQKGYQVIWTDQRKYITFTDPDGHHVRNSNLERTFHLDFSKEGLSRVFESNIPREANVSGERELEHTADSTISKAISHVEHSPLIPRSAKAVIHVAKTVRRVEQQMQQLAESGNKARGRSR